MGALATLGVTNALAGVAAGQSDRTQSWPQYRFDASNSGHAPENTALRAAVEQRWRTRDTEASLAAAVAADGRLFVASDENTLRAHDAASGDVDWTADWPEANGWMSPPAVVDGTVYCGTVDNDLYALDAASGEERWAYEREGDTDWFLSPVVRDGTVFAASSDAMVFAFDATSGDVTWQAPLENPPSSPAVANDTVYLGSINQEDGGVYALDAASGDERWTYGGDDVAPLLSAPAVTEDMVYTHGDDDRVYALDADTGEETWTVTLEDSSDGGYHAPAVVDGQVYTVSNAGILHVLDTESGEGQWTFEPEDGDSLAESPAVVNDVVYVPGEERLYAIDGATETALWTIDIEESVTPAVVDGQLYVGSSDGTLYGFTESSESRAPTLTVTDRIPPTGVLGVGLLGVAVAVYRWVRDSGGSDV